jgi:hypothetical protein
MPALRQTSSMDVPFPAWRRMNAICEYVNRDFFMEYSSGLG